MPSRRLVCALALALLSAAAPAHAAAVTELALPPGFSVAPEASRRLVSIAPDHTVVAVSEATDRSGRARAYLWSPAGSRSQFTALPVLTSPDPGNPGAYRGVGEVVASPGGAFVSATESWSGAYSGTSYEVQRWAGDGTRRWPVPPCAQNGEVVDQHANAVDARGRIALTMDISGRGSFMVHDDTGHYAPYAFVIDGGTCLALGRAVVLGLRDRWAAGYHGYLDNYLAPTILNQEQQRVVAVRWHDSALAELGAGVAYAVTSQGLTVGADARAGGYPAKEKPHAVAWDLRGRNIKLARDAPRSVAYDVGDDGTAVGTLQDADGKHYAFLWRDGHLERLDDLPHPSGWRFESAYSIAPDGTVAGIATHDGTPVVFTWRR
jgi:probable HAF family extracellular repeat protein